MQIIRLMCQVCARGQQFIISFINYVTASQLLDIRRLFPRTIISFINYVTATQLLDIRRLNQRVPRAAYNSLCICRLYIFGYHPSIKLSVFYAQYSTRISSGQLLKDRINVISDYLEVSLRFSQSDPQRVLFSRNSC